MIDQTYLTTINNYLSQRVSGFENINDLAYYDPHYQDYCLKVINIDTVDECLININHNSIALIKQELLNALIMLNGAINYDATFIKHLSKNFTTKIYNYLITHEWKLAIDFIKTIKKRYSVNLLEYEIHKMMYRIESFITL